jgi:membrane-associated protease RseP (regulator of RpoE activity)
VKTLTMLGAAVMAVSCGVAANEAFALEPYAAEAAPPAPPGAAAPPAVPAPPVVPAPPAVPAPPGGLQDAASDAKEASVEARLESARRKLEADAREVAQLSMQVGRYSVPRFETHFETGGSIIGMQISTEHATDGVRVVQVSPGGPADEAGMRPGDLIVAVNGVQTRGEAAARDAVHVIHEAHPDTKLAVRVMRDGKPKDLVVVARAVTNQFFVRTRDASSGPPGFPADSPVFSYRELGIPSLSNLQLATLTPGLGHYFGTEKGVLVVRAPTKSDFKLQDGDVILSIDGREPTSGAHATRILASYQGGEKITLHIMRDRKPLDLEAKLPDQTWDVRQYQVPRPPGVTEPEP